MADKTLASRLNRRLRLERPIEDTSLTGAGSGTWDLIEEVWAEVQDMLPSRAERLAAGMSSTTRPARVRMRYRSDITPDLRLVDGARIMQIVGQPAELGRREAIEFMVEDYAPAGNTA